MDRVKLNVSGTYFEFDKKILKEGKSPKLTRICSESRKEGIPMEATVDCSPFVFGSILAYLQMGELHIPPGVCPGAFRREMEFWELDYDCLHSCCVFRYQSFLDEEKTREEFFRKAHPAKTMVAPISTLPVSGYASRCKSKLWGIIDNNENSIPAKLYFIIISTLVVVSIFVLAYSTEPYNRRLISKCELLDYMERTQPEVVQRVRDIIGQPICTEKGSWLIAAGDWDFDYFDYNNYDWDKPKGNLAFNESNTTAKTTSSTPLKSAKTARTTSDYEEETEELNKKPIHIPKLTLSKPIFNILDIAVNVVFTVDFVLRIFSCPSLRLYFSSVINVLDALALISTYIYVIIVSVERKYLYEPSPSVILLNFAQVFRALRLFRVVKNVRASKVLAFSLKSDVKDMTLLITLLFVGVSTFAYLIYFAEPRHTVQSVPKAWYWAIVTMTTVGYGDISPTTGLGMLISSLCAISGVLLLSITLPMFVNNFLTLYQYSCVNESIERKRDMKERKSKTEEWKCSEIVDLDDLKTSNCSETDLPPSYRSPRNNSLADVKNNG